MQPLAADELLRLKRHIAEDLLPLHHRRVTHSLLALAAVAVLHRYSGVTHRFAGWLKGESGAGKTLPAKLYMCFFGNFRPKDDDDSSVVHWAWTVNSIETTGFLFRDALFLVDDFKTELVQRPQVV